MDDTTVIDVYAAKTRGEKYDESCKRLFGNKEILAPILKYTVREYRNSSVQDIIRYIDKDSISDADPVGDVPVRMEGMDSEMSSIAEKLVRFDKRFKAAVPGQDGNLHCTLHFDFEIQNNYRPSSPSYPVPKRAVYYAARELSSQLGSITEETDYSALRKCYSIWVCNENIPESLENTVTSYRMQAENLSGNVDFDTDYDLMEVVMILRSRNPSSTPVLDYLDGVFKSDLGKIEKYVDVGTNARIVTEVKKMSGLGATIAKENYDRGHLEGHQEGRQEGRQEGFQEGKITVFKNMVLRKFSVEEAMSLAGITKEQAEQALKEINKNS